jgi:hypothetical protein
MVSLVDDGKLTVILQDTRDPARRRFRFTFTICPVYRNILEEFRRELWKEIKGQTEARSWTLTIPESQWIAYFSEAEPLLEEYYPGLTHYMICTEDDVVEILSSQPPQITEIEPATEGDKVPGKSTVYIYPEDKDKVDKLVNEVMEANDLRPDEV